MIPGNNDRKVAFLTSQESSEIIRIKQDPGVVGFALIGLDGTEIEASGAFHEMSAAIFANVFDVADKIGEEFGVTDTCPMMFMDSPDYEVVGVTMSSAKAVIIKRKEKQAAEGLRSVS